MPLLNYMDPNQDPATFGLLDQTGGQSGDQQVSPSGAAPQGMVPPSDGMMLPKSGSPSLWDHVKETLSALGHGIQKHAINYRDSLVPPPTPEMQSMFSPEELQKARRLAFANLSVNGDPAQAQSAFNDALTKTVSFATLKRQQDEQKRILGERQRIGAQFAPQPGESQDQFETRARGMYGEYMRAGDLESAKTLDQVMAVMAHKGPAEKPQREPIKIDAGDRWLYRDADSHELLKNPDGSLMVDMKNAAPKAQGEITPSDQYRAAQEDKIIGDYRADPSVKAYTEAVGAYRGMQAGLENPNLTSPMAAMEAYAKIMNPGAVVRSGFIVALKELGGVGQKVDRWISEAKDGTWPAGMMEAFNTTAKSKLDKMRKDYLDARTRAIVRGQRGKVPVEMDSLLSDPGMDIFAPTGPAGPKPPGDASKFKSGLGKGGF